MDDAGQHSIARDGMHSDVVPQMDRQPDLRDECDTTTCHQSLTQIEDMKHLFLTEANCFQPLALEKAKLLGKVSSMATYQTTNQPYSHSPRWKCGGERPLLQVLGLRA